jgi:hypothetical protein
MVSVSVYVSFASLEWDKILYLVACYEHSLVCDQLKEGSVITSVRAKAEFPFPVLESG